MKELNIQELKELESNLNKEYSWLWKIYIQNAYKDNVNVNNISFVQSIMDIVNPLDIDEPIILAKKYWQTHYIIVDWYHRVKNWLLSWKIQFDSVILDKYNINRINDNLFNFLSNNVWNKISFIDDYIIRIWKEIYQILPNEWCWWFSNWRSEMVIKKEYINKKMLVKEVKQEYVDDDVYDLYINWYKVAEVDTWRWNGYYGWDFEINKIL